MGVFPVITPILKPKGLKYFLYLAAISSTEEIPDIFESSSASSIRGHTTYPWCPCLSSFSRNEKTGLSDVQIAVLMGFLPFGICFMVKTSILSPYIEQAIVLGIGVADIVMVWIPLSDFFLIDSR